MPPNLYLASHTISAYILSQFASISVYILSQFSTISVKKHSQIKYSPGYPLSQSHTAPQSTYYLKLLLSQPTNYLIFYHLGSLTLSGTYAISAAYYLSLLSVCILFQFTYYIQLHTISFKYYLSNMLLPLIHYPSYIMQQLIYYSVYILLSLYTILITHFPSYILSLLTHYPSYIINQVIHLSVYIFSQCLYYQHYTFPQLHTSRLHTTFSFILSYYLQLISVSH